jgi:multidrug resistance efflux pump
MPNMKKSTLALIWLAALIGAATLYYRINVAPAGTILGVVESIMHDVAAVESGVLRKVHVDVGSVVVLGQVLVELDSSALDVELARLRQESSQSQLLLGEDAKRGEVAHARFVIAHDQEGNRLNSEILAVQQSRDEIQGDLESKRTEVKGLSHQVERLEKAGASGFGQADALASLITRRDTLLRYCQEREQVLDGVEKRLVNARAGLKAWESVNVAALQQAPDQRRLADIAQIESRIAACEKMISQCAIHSPCNGTIVSLHLRSGDSVNEFTPIVTVQDTTPSQWVDAYVPEASPLEATVPGMRVNVHSARRAAVVGGVVHTIHPGYVAMPPELQSQSVPVIARKMRIRLDAGIVLLPGERTRVRLMGKTSDGGAGFMSLAAQESPILAPSNKSNGVVELAKRLEDIAIPKQLKKRSNFEPSGLVWLRDIERYLVVSDDTGTPAHNRHESWLFLMDRDGAIEADPIMLVGAGEMDDVESVCMRDDGAIYLISSQSMNKNGDLPVSRQMLFQVKRSDRKFTVEYSVPLRSLLAGMPGGEIMDTADLDIEGSAYRDGSLYFGLKSPRESASAIIWRMTDPDAFFSRRALAPGQLTRYGAVDLGHDGAGISDLAFDQQGRLIILASPVDDRQAKHGLVLVVDQVKAGPMTARCVATFAKRKPEGIAETEDGNWAIVCEEGINSDPSWLTTRIDP